MSNLVDRVVRRLTGEVCLHYGRTRRRIRRVSSLRRVATALTHIRAVLTGFGVAIFVIPSTFAILGRVFFLLCFLVYRWLHEANPLRITRSLNQFVCFHSERLECYPSSSWLGKELKEILDDLEAILAMINDLLMVWKQAQYSRWKMNLLLVGCAFGASWAIFVSFVYRLLESRQGLK